MHAEALGPLSFVWAYYRDREKCRTTTKQLIGRALTIPNIVPSLQLSIIGTLNPPYGAESGTRLLIVVTIYGEFRMDAHFACG